MRQFLEFMAKDRKEITCYSQIINSKLIIAKEGKSTKGRLGRIKNRNISNVLYSQSNYEQALEFHEKALSVHKEPQESPHIIM
jgi:hypothetical protein